jgi:putative transposase
MSRALRVEFPGAVYHVTSRGNFRQEIFHDDDDRQTFLNKVQASAERYGFIVHAYCLMSNHYHILMETTLPNLSRAMQRINGDYTMAVNHKYGRVGHLFQGRFKAVLIEKESHLLEVARYVVLNPVRARMVEKIESWKWSSYPATAGISSSPVFLHNDWILGRFGRSEAQCRRRYISFVAEGLLKKGSPFSSCGRQAVLGNKAFAEKWKEVIVGRREIKEFPRMQRLITRPGLEEIFNKETTPLTKNQLSERIKEAHLTHGYTLNEIAAHIGVHYSTAGRILKKMLNCKM